MTHHRACISISEVKDREAKMWISLDGIYIINLELADIQDFSFELAIIITKLWL